MAGKKLTLIFLVVVMALVLVLSACDDIIPPAPKAQTTTTPTPAAVPLPQPVAPPYANPPRVLMPFGNR